MRLPLRSAAVIMLAAVMFSGCSKSDNNSADENLFDTEKAFEDYYGGISAAESGPQLSISSTTAKAGEVAEVTVSVSNAKNNWSSCGFHIVYSDKLKCVLIDDEDSARDVDFALGEACRGAFSAVAKEWQEDLPKELSDDKLKALFFTASFEGNRGGEGNIATFKFIVPDNANPGDVFDIDFYYYGGEYTKDIFINAQDDESLEKYAFQNWKGGTITIE